MTGAMIVSGVIRGMRQVSYWRTGWLFRIW